MIDALSNCTLYSQQQLQTAGGLLPNWPATWLKHKRRSVSLRAGIKLLDVRRTKEVSSFVNYTDALWFFVCFFLVMRVAPPSNAK